MIPRNDLEDKMFPNKDEQVIMPALRHSQNPTDGNIDIFSNLEAQDSEVYSDEWQKETIRNARFDGYIKLYNLVFILAAEEKYSNLIQSLWDFFYLKEKTKLLDGKIVDTIDNKNTLIPEWDPSWINTAQGRANPWYWILLGCTIKPFFLADGIRCIESQYFGYMDDEDEKLRKRINLYKYFNRQPEKVNDDEEQSPIQYLKVSEFEEYINSVLSNIISI